jgi:hypothetical protein
MSETTRAQNTEYPKINSKTNLDDFISAVKSSSVNNSAVNNSDRPSGPHPNLSASAPANATVARCIEAYADAMQDALERRQRPYEAAKEASRAFRQLMPPLSRHENIRDFIACVAQAILMEAIPGDEAARLLYAAQIAYAARETRNSKNQSKPSQAASRSL